MTPNNILHMAMLKELDLIALTDHNSCKNCPALMRAAEGSGLWVIAGMELTTAEEIHVVCLFERLEQAMAFDKYVYNRLASIQNVPDIFGNQLILDAQDMLLGQEERLLVNATSIAIGELPNLMRHFGGVCYPAHIDRASYSVLSSLGNIPPECGFKGIEVFRPDVFFANQDRRALREEYTVITSSDAHRLEAIMEREHCIHLEYAGYKGLAGRLL